MAPLQSIIEPSGETSTEEHIEPKGSSPDAPEKVSYLRYIIDQPLITREVLNWTYHGSGTDEDPYSVVWIKDDPRNPLLIKSHNKVIITALMAISTLAAAFMSSTYAGALPQVMEAFHVGTEVALLGLALYVLGFSVGPLFWAPLGEIYGRQIILFITYFLFTVFNGTAAASQNIETLLVLRFFAGAFAASALTNTGAVIADIYTVDQRGLAMGLFASAPFMGPVLGPIIGGFVGQSSAGWRWTQGIAALFSGTLWFLSAVIVPETYAPVLLRKRAHRLSEMTGKVYLSAADLKSTDTGSASEKLWKALTLPWLLLIHEPIIIFLTVYMSLIYGILYLLFGAYPIAYQEGRGWNEGQGGLAFLGIAVGELLAIAYSIPDNIRFTRRWKNAGGKAAPEARLTMAMIGAFAPPIGLFWFAWTSGPDVHWMASVAAGAPFGFGMVLLFISIKNYIVDSYTVFSASALACTVVVRSLFAAAFPLFTDQMFHGLGIHWASCIPAFLALACAPIPFVLYKWGPSIRAKCKYSRKADEIAKAAQGGN